MSSAKLKRLAKKAYARGDYKRAKQLITLAQQSPMGLPMMPETMPIPGGDPLPGPGDEVMPIDGAEVEIEVDEGGDIPGLVAEIQVAAKQASGDMVEHCLRQCLETLQRLQAKEPMEKIGPAGNPGALV